MGSLDATGKQKSSDVVSTFNNAESPEPGIYFVIVSAVKYLDKDGYEVVEMDVLGGTTSGQKGKQLALFMKYKENGDFGDAHHRFALAARLMEGGTKKEDPDFSFWKSAEGRYLVVSAEASDDDVVWIGNYGLDIWGPHESDLPAKLSDMDGDVAAIFAQSLTPIRLVVSTPAVQGSDSQIASPSGNGESVNDADEWEGL